MKQTLTCIVLVLSAIGCSRPHIDHSYRAKSQDSRAQFLILHFTGGTWEASLKTLTQDNVSSHYLVRDNPVRIYQLVSEDRRAYQAGDSSWKGQTQLNAASIGIEIQNLGDTKGPDGIVYHDYPKAQIDAVIELVKGIVARHEIRADRILGHSDIAPQRKVDPGPTFPWKRLADEGIIPWPDASAVAAKREAYEAALPNIAWFQAKLAEHGFAAPQTGQLDTATKNILSVFQMKYRPSRYDGLPDAETAAILDVLTTPKRKGP
ncbi:MAG: N-acetylmuramoyl-L-alanine amidase [Holophagaceae bacterium]|nr:N-acetylmuramoyl-L-alanine amidase [Holophagaceae bacterium]